jgi:hypothetical protein
LIVSPKLGPVLDFSGIKSGELRVRKLPDGIAWMNDELDKGIADVSAHIVRRIDEPWLFCIDGSGGGFERFGKHRNVGPALNEIGEAACGAARRNRDLDAGQLLDLGFVWFQQAETYGRGAMKLHLRASRACERQRQNGERRCTSDCPDQGDLLMKPTLWW